MRNFLKIVDTFDQKLWLFWRELTENLRHLLPLTQPSAQRTSRGVSYDSTKMRPLTTATGLRAMSGGRRLTSPVLAFHDGKIVTLSHGCYTTEQSERYLSFRNGDVTTSSSEEN